MDKGLLTRNEELRAKLRRAETQLETQQRKLRDMKRVYDGKLAKALQDREEETRKAHEWEIHDLDAKIETLTMENEAKAGKIAALVAERDMLREFLDAVRELSNTIGDR